MFKIGTIEMKNNVILAPMAGISNPAYMKIVEDLGCDYAITELLSAEAISRDNKKTIDMLNGIDKLNIPVAVQIFGSNPITMAKAAKLLVEKYNIKIIDINMGCPVPKVAISSNSGSALLKDPNKVYDIVKAVVESVDIPVTVKIRSGWDSNSINAVEIAKKIEEAGASAITVHPRTRSQGYTGLADWNIIKEVKQNVKIPVIGNGDIKTVYDAKKMIDETGCDAVMIGRACLGNPWLIKDCINYLENNVLPNEIGLKEKIDIIKKHTNLLIENKNEKIAILEMRANASWYLKGIQGGNDIRRQITSIKTKEDLFNILDRLV